MATQHQRRPDGKAPADKAADAAARDGRARLDAEKRAQEALREGGELDAQSAQQLAAHLGNAALGAMVGGQEAELLEDEEREREQADEEALEESKAEDAGARDAALPAMGDGGSGGGGAGGPTMPPWELGRMFGGEDDDDPAEWRRAPWVPATPPSDPDDEPVEVDDLEDGGAVAEEDPAWVEARSAAESALGVLPWRATPVGRGMRSVARNVGPRLEAEDLVTGGELPLGRLLAGARFLAGGAPTPALRAMGAWIVRVAARAHHPAAGRAGTTALVAALVEGVLDHAGGAEDSAAARAMDVAVDVRARPLAEQAAAARMEEGDLAAPRIFLQAWGAAEQGTPLPSGPRSGLGVDAPAQAARVLAFPTLDSHASVPLEPEALLDAIDAVLAAFTEAETEPPDPTAALRVDLDRTLAALGRAQVELVAAGLAVTPWVEAGAILATLAAADEALRGEARILVAHGEALQAAREASAAGAPDGARAGLEAARHAASFALAGVAARGVEARDAALAALGAAALGGAPAIVAAGRPRPGDDDVSRVLDEALRGEVSHAWEAIPSRGVRRALRAAAAAIARADGRATDAEAHAVALLEAGVDDGAPWAVVQGACMLAALAEHPSEAHEALQVAGDWARAGRHAAPLQLLKAVWTEETLRRTSGGAPTDAPAG